MYTSEESLASSRLRIDCRAGDTGSRIIPRLFPIEMMVDQAGESGVKWSDCGEIFKVDTRFPDVGCVEKRDDESRMTTRFLA